jgi:adhesin transport system membrane fusion protein
VFGSMPGRVTFVGQDSITEDKNEIYFPVKVSLSGSSIEKDGRVYSVIPGMVAQVDIIAGKRTVLSYIFSPITKVLQTSFREK